MEIKFAQEYLKELYETGECNDKKRRFQKSVIAKYQRRIDTLESATRIEDLYVFNSLNFEALIGTDRFSIRIDLKFRLEFSVETNNGEANFVTICLIQEISNHYK